MRPLPGRSISPSAYVGHTVRAERIRFHTPWFRSGQRILVRQDGGASEGEPAARAERIGHLQTFAGIGILILLATILVTLFDRKFDQDCSEALARGHRRCASFGNVGGDIRQGPMAQEPVWLGGPDMAGLWLVSHRGACLCPSSATSVMTALTLTNQINSVADLPGRIVGVQPGSVSEDYARQAGLNTRPVQHIEEAADALADGAVDAVLGDAPVLEYYTHNNPGRGLTVVGPIFAPDKYAFGLPNDSALTRPLSVEIIGLHESGRLEEIRTRYSAR